MTEGLAGGVLVGVLAEGSLGGTDCETIHTGTVAQPVLAATSLAYVVVGLAIMARSRRATLEPSVARAAPWLAGGYGLAVALEGVGSVLFHGPQTWGARWLHDWAIVAILAVIATVDWTLLTRRPLPSSGAVAALLALTGVGMAVLPAVGAVLGALVVVGAVVGEVLVVVRGLRLRGRGGIDGPWGLLLPAGMMVVAVASYALGRTGAPLCDPDSVLQLHGLWHILTALTFGWWARVALFAPGSVEPPGSVELPGSVEPPASRG